MVHEGAEVKRLMDEVERVTAADSSMHDEFWKGERPQLFSLLYLYPFPERSESELDRLSREWNIEGMFEIRSGRRVIGPLVVLVKRLILAATRWYMNPVVFEVKRMNMLVARALRDVSENMVEITDRLGGLEKAQEELSERIAGLEEAGGDGDET